MKYCKKCPKLYLDDENMNFCPKCGTVLQTVAVDDVLLPYEEIIVATLNYVMQDADNKVTEQPQTFHKMKSNIKLALDRVK